MKYNKWKDTFVVYLKNSSNYWGENTRQNGKLVKIKEKICQKHNLSSNNYIDFIVNIAENRSNNLQKLYISNIGGSGSHWLSAMLEDLMGWFDVGEVYLPPFIYKEIMCLKNKREAAKFYDSVEMLHGFLYRITPKEAVNGCIINSAHGVEKIPIHKELFDKCKIIHLFRDPRDRTMSVTYRKDEYRQYARPDLTDEEYLFYNSNRVRTGYLRYSNQKEKADLELKYEDIKQETSDSLQQICNLLDMKISKENIKKTAEKYSAKKLIENENILLRGNLFVSKGNLARGWEETASFSDIRIMHSCMKQAITGYGYEIADCFGNNIKYHQNIIIDKKTYSFLLKYDDSISIFRKNVWIKPDRYNVNKGNIIKGIRLNTQKLDSETTSKILKNIKVTLLCLNNKKSSYVREILHFNKQIKVPYIDASFIKDFPVDLLNMFKNLQIVNLSGCEVVAPSKYSKKAIIDF